MDRDRPEIFKRSYLAPKEANSSRKRPKLSTQASSFLCGHCNQRLSRKTFKKHEKLYKRSDQSWTKEDEGLCEDQITGLWHTSIM